MELKIKLKVKDVEIELTKDEAIELKDLLDKLCTQKTEYVPWQPYYPTYPTYPWTYSPEWWRTTDGGTRWDWAIPCDDNTTWTTTNISDNVRVSYSHNTDFAKGGIVTDPSLCLLRCWDCD